MRILMLSQFYPPVIGGEEQHVRTLSIELAARGHDIAVVTLWQQGLAKFELDRGVRIYRICGTIQRLPWLFTDKGRPFAPPFPDPGIMLALRQIIEREHPEIVHAHNWLAYSFLPLKSWSKARFIVTLHNFNLVCAKLTLMYHDIPCSGPNMVKCLKCAGRHYGVAKGVPTVLGNWTMAKVEKKAADMFLVVSHAVAVDNGLINDELPFQVIPNFMPDVVDMLQGDADSYLEQLPSEDFLLFVGALGHSKGVDVLLRAYKDLSGAPPLVLIGYQTPEWSALAEHIPDNVFVFKNWPRHAVMAAWKRSMIALVPSVWAEPFGIVAIEAMSVGRPIIASRIGGLIDIVVDGETGLLVEPGSVSALRFAMEQLLANPDLRIRMGKAALRKVVDFQAETVIPRIEQIYERVLA
jgi:glycosyltransferase involved in cell wall biosynthesis